MEKEWFNECILMNDENHLADIGSSAILFHLKDGMNYGR